MNKPRMNSQLIGWILAASIIFAQACVPQASPTEEPMSDFEITLGKVARTAVFVSDSLSIWGGSLVKGEDDLYHLYYSQWPKAIGWEW
ncbi:MAG: sucrase, partial [Bacteroidota bacterium]